MQELIADLEAVVYGRLGNWPAAWEGYHWPGYTWEHTLRVRALALRLAREVGADEDVVGLAALLHDIEKEVGKEHAHVGAVEAERLLRERDVDPELTEAVRFAIDSHAGENTPDHPIENLVLGDADLIDANFGLVGTWRFITIRAGHQSTPEETVAGMSEWLPKKDALLDWLNTDGGRAVADERSAMMRAFCGDLDVAFGDGEAGAGLRDWVCFINANHERGSMMEQLPGLREMGESRGDDAVVCACERLAAEAGGKL